MAWPISFSMIATVIELTKPRALMMIVYTTCLGYMIAATRAIELLHLWHTALGVAIAAAGSLALNQFIERDLDAKMERTKGRPIPSGRISARAAFLVGMTAMIAGYIYLWVMVNPGCSLATMICGLSYLLLYTPLKPRSSLSSFVGAVPGGMLPIMGWVAARGHLEIGGWVLFVILFIWQIPHALIISYRYHDDYRAAGMKQLPLVSQRLTTRRHIIWNVLVLIPVTLLPYYLNMTEMVYPLTAAALGLVLFVQTSRFVLHVSEKRAKAAFIALTAYLPLLLLAMYLDKPA